MQVGLEIFPGLMLGNPKIEPTIFLFLDLKIFSTKNLVDYIFWEPEIKVDKKYFESFLNP